MAAPGPTPKDDSTRTEWIDVEEKPYAGKVPISMPRARSMFLAGEIIERDYLAETARWFKTVCSVPHATLWGPGDWALVESTLPVVDNAFLGVTSAAAELRRREDLLGLTIEARRKLRIRYVPIGSNTGSSKQAAAAKAAQAKTEALKQRQKNRHAKALASNPRAQKS